MATYIVEASPHHYPLNGTSFIHRQSGWPDLIHVGPTEIARLPRRQQEGLRRLLTANPRPQALGLLGFLSTQDGQLFLTTSGPPVAAKVNSRGQAIKFVDWL